MNPDKQRIAIAEACGITPKRERTNPLVFPGVEVYWNCPDYLNDLNAMNQAAMWLRSTTPLAYVHYTAEITRIVAKFNSDLEDHYSISAHDATAVQRAEAFLKAISKWEEE